MTTLPYFLPPIGGNPSSNSQGTSPGAFANPSRVGTPYTFSSPDTPGMPRPSDITATKFASARDAQGKTQLESARVGIITPQMQRVAEREPHLTPEQVRDEVAAGRMVIPANKVHLAYQLDPCAIGRAGHDQDQRQHGRLARSRPAPTRKSRSCSWAETLGRRHRDGPLHRRRPRTPAARRSSSNATVPIGTVPIYSMIIGRKIEDLTYDMILEELEHQAKQGVDYFTIHAGVLREHLPLRARTA